jgi:hypothetical protein
MTLMMRPSDWKRVIGLSPPDVDTLVRLFEVDVQVQYVVHFPAVD